MRYSETKFFIEVVSLARCVARNLQRGEVISGVWRRSPRHSLEAIGVLGTKSPTAGGKAVLEQSLALRDFTFFVQK